jgi:hypothetical protein
MLVVSTKNMKSRYYGFRVQQLIGPVLARFYPDEYPPPPRVNPPALKSSSGQPTIDHPNNGSSQIVSNRNQPNSHQWTEGVPNTLLHGYQMDRLGLDMIPTPPQPGMPFNGQYGMTPLNIMHCDPQGTPFQGPFEGQHRTFVAESSSTGEPITSPGINPSTGPKKDKKTVKNRFKFFFKLKGG